MIDQSDENLLLNWKNGDEQSFRIIYSKYFIVLVKETYRKIGDLQLAEEIVQDAFLSLYKNRDRTNNEVKKYLSLIVKHKIIDQYRKKNNPLKNGWIEDIDEMKSSNNIDNNIDYQYLSFRIQKVMNMLSDKSRNIYLLSREYNLSNKEIAERLGISVKTG